MKFTLSLTNMEALELYSLLETLSLDRAQNRARWSFLKVLEDNVIEFEQEQRALIQPVSEKNAELDTFDREKKEERLKAAKLKFALIKMVPEVNKKIDQLGMITKDYVFDDKDTYLKVETIFKDIKVETLKPQQARYYNTLTDRFAEVKMEN